MADIAASETPTVGLGSLILHSRFHVPQHQRDYKWDRERVKTYLDDLFEALDRHDHQYFVGMMVFMADQDKLRVLDGQQRLATTIILYSAIRDWFQLNAPDSSTSTQIQADFIGRSDYGDTDIKPKLELNVYNNDLFQKHVTSGSDTESLQLDVRNTGRKGHNVALIKSIEYVRSRVSEQAEACGPNKKAIEFFSNFIKFIRDQVVVVRLTVPNESNAFRVFETLNDRGMDLSAIDLLKNYLFGAAHSKSKTSLAQLERDWTTLIQILQESRQDDFLKVYWTSRHGLTQLNQVYDAVKSKVKNGNQAEALASDMIEAARNYAATDDMDDSIWANQTVKSRESMNGIRVLGSKLVRPTIISALQKLTPKQVEQLLTSLEVAIVRWQVIGEGRTGTIERALARLAQKIWDGTAKTIKDFKEALAEIYTSDKEFISNFSNQEGLANKKVVYLLRRIEMHQRRLKSGKHSRELVPSTELTLEHIFPMSHGSEWEATVKSNKDLVDYIERIGNLCLLTSDTNRTAERMHFDAKKKIYAKSDLITTEDVACYAKWTTSEIEERQLKLAHHAAQIWRF